MGAVVRWLEGGTLGECSLSYLEEGQDAKVLLPLCHQWSGCFLKGWWWREQSPLTNQQKWGTAVQDQGLAEMKRLIYHKREKPVARPWEDAR